MIVEKRSAENWPKNSTSLSYVPPNAEKIIADLEAERDKYKAQVEALEESCSNWKEGFDNAQLTNEAFAKGLKDARASFLGLQPDFGGPVAAQMGAAVSRINAILNYQ